jgi:two-component system sensor histidine kinase BarA
VRRACRAAGRLRLRHRPDLADDSATVPLKGRFFLAALVGCVAAVAAAWMLRAAFGWAAGSTAHLLTLAVALLGSLRIAHEVVDRVWVKRSVATVVAGIERLRDGETDHRIAPGGGEFTEIARAVHRLADHGTLSREALACQVEERTRDLRAVLAEAQERSDIAEEVNRSLAELDRRRLEFLSNVSHELRTPLNSILGFLMLHLDRMYESEAEAREFLENARFSASHLLQIVNDVLSATQIEAGSVRLAPRPLHPGDVIHEVMRVMELHARGKDVALRIEVDGRAMVLADALKLRQILINLLSNALKFTEEGEIVLRARAAGDAVRFEVRDTGAGIEAEDLERIFERFHRIDNPLTRALGGTGMGLAICRQLVELMGGEIGADSDGPGKGSVLWFTLPAARTQAPATL